MSEIVFGKVMPPIRQVEIEYCPEVTGMKPSDPLMWEGGGGVSIAVMHRVWGLPWSGKRQHLQVLIRPQDCRKEDARIGSFWHLDMNVGLYFAPDWDDMILHIVSFGDVAETEFVPTALKDHELAPRPSAQLYQAPFNIDHLMSVRADNKTAHAKPNQVVTYTSRHWHRGGALRNPGRRLVIIGVESDHLQPLGGVLPLAR